MARYRRQALAIDAACRQMLEDPEERGVLVEHGPGPGEWGRQPVR